MRLLKKTIMQPINDFYCEFFHSFYLPAITSVQVRARADSTGVGWRVWMGLSIIYCQDLKGLCVIAASQTQHLSELCDMMCRFGHIDPLFIDDRLRGDLIVSS